VGRQEKVPEEEGATQGEGPETHEEVTTPQGVFPPVVVRSAAMITHLLVVDMGRSR
jgi:hypothetical protein